jgi:hypothetical protein
MAVTPVRRRHRPRKGWARLAVGVVGVIAVLGAAAASAAPVDLELVIAVDVSRSVDDEEYQMQKQGYAAAFGSRAVIEAIAHARPGGVLFHCMGGRDRTGMIAMLVLALVGVAAEDIAADYELSAGAHPDSAAVATRLARAGTSARAELLRTLAALDLEPFADVRAALRARLLT